MKKFLSVLAVVAIVAFAAPAFAANPFMDVPAGHWAYDAVAQLASKGIVSGYPDGAFKGAQPSTRYEVASVVARALAYEDLKNASKEDLEMLKRLVMEFKDELDALGVKVDKIDKRVAVLEDRLGGWKLRGELRLDAKFMSGDDSNNTQWTDRVNTNKEFTKERFRLYLTKQIDENTYFETQYRAGAWASSQAGDRRHRGRGESNWQSWNKIFVKTKLPYDVDFRVGRFQFDWEDDAGLYTDEDAAFGDWRVDGFEFTKKWGMFTGKAVIGRNMSGEGRNPYIEVNNQSMLYALNLDWRPTEKLMFGAMGYLQQFDGLVNPGSAAEYDHNGDIKTYAGYAGFKFTPAVQLKGIYYWQDGKFSDGSGAPNLNPDTQKMWKAILDVKQDALKFTSLWIEYAEEDNGFGGNNVAWDGVARYSIGTYKETGVFNVRPVGDFDSKSKYWFISAKQKWNDKWGTFLRYTKADWGRDDLDNATEWGVGATYQYTPAISFMLAYDSVDYGDKNINNYAAKDNMVIFRTSVKF